MPENNFKIISELTPQQDTSPDPWVHRSKGMTCTTCMWFVEKTANDGTVKLGRCRKNAPTMNGYPVVFPTDWCGQHKLDENKL